MRRDLVLGSVRELRTVGFVAGLAGAYAATMLTSAGMLSALSDDASGSLAMFLGVVSSVFIGIALYVAAVVISAGVTTVIAGRLQHIAVLRVLGARGADLRTAIARSTCRIALLGAAIGALLGTALTDAARMVLEHRGDLPHAHYPFFSWGTPFAVLAIAGTAALAGWTGSRRVLSVAPALAMAGSAGVGLETRRAGRLRAGAALVLSIGGVGVMAIAMYLGEVTVGPGGFLLSFLAATMMTTGILLGARFVAPAIVSGMGRLLGTDAPSLIARRNSVADRGRTTRSTMGLFIGVALVTSVASGGAALHSAVATWPDLTPADQARADQALTVVTSVTIMVGVVSAVIAAAGFVSTMSLTIIQRRREIGLVRALGFTGRQVRTMITKESIAMSLSATGLGVLTGLFFGSASAQALVGHVTPGFVWGLPWLVLVAIVLAATALILLAARPPARRATAMSTVVALRPPA